MLMEALMRVAVVFCASVPEDGAQECEAGAGGEEDGAAAGERGEFVDVERTPLFRLTVVVPRS